MAAPRCASRRAQATAALCVMASLTHRLTRRDELLCYLQKIIYFRLPRRCPASPRLSAAVAIISPALRAKRSSSIGPGGTFAFNDGGFIGRLRRSSEGRVGVFFWRTDCCPDCPRAF
jgi:hypothetical protein